jgi:hypothetical protein
MNLCRAFADVDSFKIAQCKTLGNSLAFAASTTHCYAHFQITEANP